MKNTFVAVAIVLGMFLFASNQAHAEWYAGGQVGFVKPNDLKNVEGTDSTKGIELRDQYLKNTLGNNVCLATPESLFLMSAKN